MANTFISNEFTDLLQKLVREVVNDPSTYLGSKYLPSIALPVRTIRVEVVEASGGLTNEHVVGTSPEYVQAFGTRVQEFSPPAYKEAIHYAEDRILYLRQLGENDRSQRGIQKYIELDVDRLNRRLEARMEKQRWDALFNGGYTFMGKTISFGVPAANRAVPVGAVWSSDGISANNTANPLIDIRYWLEGGLGAWRKYMVSELIMNPNTARWILDNTNTKSFITSFAANPVMNEWSVEKVMAYVIPGGPKVSIYKGWYQTESLVGAKLTVSDAVYMIPDGYIFALVSNLPGGDKVGEFVQGVNLASGTIENPGFGKFLVMDDNTAPGTKGGPANPYLDIVAGVYGGVKLDRPFDVLTAKVIS